jgi:hydrogenase maturation factor
LIASGSLLLVVGAADAQSVCNALRNADIEAAVIGRVTPRANGVMLRSSELESSERRGEAIKRPLPKFERDEIARLFDA